MRFVGASAEMMSVLLARHQKVQLMVRMRSDVKSRRQPDKDLANPSATNGWLSLLDVELKRRRWRAWIRGTDIAPRA